MEFFDLLKASKGLPVRDPLAVMWGQQLTEDWPVISVTGSLPLTFESKGGALSTYRLYGTSEGAGVQTENLVTEIIQNASIGSTGKLTTSNLYNASIAPITAGTTYTLLRDYTTASLYYAFFTELPAIGSVSYDGSREDVRQLSVTITAPVTGYVVLLNKKGESTVAEGNTAIPYGYKIPLSIAGKNEFDKTATNPNKGYVDGRYLIGGDTTSENAAWAVSEYIAVRPGTEYIWQWRERSSSVANPRLAIYDSTYTTIDTIRYGDYAPNANHIPFTTGATAAFVRLSYEKSSIDEAALYKTSTTPVYIGSSKLYEEEYLDYESGKVYKRTDNLLNFDDLVKANSGVMPGTSYEFPKLLNLTIKPNTTYTLYSDGTGSTSGAADENRSVYIQNATSNNTVFNGHPASVTTDSTGNVYIGFYIERANAAQYVNGTAHLWLLEGDEAQGSFILYLQPTDPPVPLPVINTYSGKNTLYSSETIEQAEVTGKIKEQK